MADEKCLCDHCRSRYSWDCDDGMAYPRGDCRYCTRFASKTCDECMWSTDEIDGKDHWVFDETARQLKECDQICRQFELGLIDRNTMEEMLSADELKRIREAPKECN